MRNGSTAPKGNLHHARTSNRAARAAALARKRRHRKIAWSAVAAVVVVAAVSIALVSVGGGRGSSAEVMPPGVGGGTPDVQPAALALANTSGISGVVAYDATGWPADSHNGPIDRALGHTHVAGPVVYSVTPPVGGDHNATWLNCGVYDQPVPNERAVHDLEHGAVWITYSPSLPTGEVAKLRSFEQRQSVVAMASRYVDLSPYPGLGSPIVISSWGFQLRVTSPSDPRLQRFVDNFRMSPRYSPEYGGECTGGLGTPLAT